MAYLPSFTSLTVRNYGLFPGVQKNGITLDLKPGLTMIIGANGLGKSTLVAMMYRMLTGPFDIPGLTGRGELGFASLEPRHLSPTQRAQFAQRVSDGANKATAKIAYVLGTTRVEVTRSLADLSLQELSINGKNLDTDEHTFQREVAAAAETASFGDWILLLRTIVFYTDDRRGLIWDASAQRQVLRALFLGKEDAYAWTLDERDVLAIDSRMRNLRAVLSKEERALAVAAGKAKIGPEVRHELAALQGLQEEDDRAREDLEQGLLDLETLRDAARLRVLTVEQERESAFRAVERYRLDAIRAAFPAGSETAHYILAQLLSDDHCLVCGSDSPSAAEHYAARLDNSLCIVCATPVVNDSAESDHVDADSRLALQEALHAQDASLMDARAQLNSADKTYIEAVQGVSRLTAAANVRSERINFLISQLPAEEADLHKQKGELSLMRGRVEDLKADLQVKREAFRKRVMGHNATIAAHAEAIKASFSELASGFLLEKARLVWQTRPAPLGQEGIAIDYPAFSLEMSGADFTGLVRRGGPNQVSESQRDFVDLAFRMALMSVAVPGDRGASLVVDAPEASVDAVFAQRAAAVLARYAGQKQNRLVVTSNLVEGSLVPTLLGMALKPDEIRDRVVDLLVNATPTAAVREKLDEYTAVRDDLITQAEKRSSALN